MLTGFNTDIEFDGVTYHVQTEDRGTGNPLIESLVYVRGEILAARRTEYRNLLDAGADTPAIRTLMERQHHAIVDAIRNGRIDLLTEPQVGTESDTTVSRRPPAFGGRPGPGPVEAAKRSSKTLDEVIGDWLAEQRRVERLRIHVDGGTNLRFGATFAFAVRVDTTPGDNPVSGAHVVVRFLSTASKATILAEGKSTTEGRIELKGQVPELEKGTGLVVVTAQHQHGTDEVKFLVQR